MEYSQLKEMLNSSIQYVKLLGGQKDITQEQCCSNSHHNLQAPK